MHCVHMGFAVHIEEFISWADNIYQKITYSERTYTRRTYSENDCLYK